MNKDGDLRNLIEEILYGSREMVLATSADNIPWACVLVFGHDKDLDLYWISFENTRHSQEIDKNPNVAATVTKDPAGGGQDKGLQIQGSARKLKAEEILGAAKEYFAKRGTPKMPQTLEDANTLAEGRSWYILKPTKIKVLYGPLFGYEAREFIP